MSETELPLRATLKAGAGYEAPWLTVAGSSVTELEGLLDDLHEQFIQKVIDAAAGLRAAHTVAAGLAEPAPAAPSATQTQVASGTLKTCAHGVRTKRQGHSSRGAWTGYFCPLPKGDPNQCKAIFED